MSNPQRSPGAPSRMAISFITTPSASPRASASPSGDSAPGTSLANRNEPTYSPELRRPSPRLPASSHVSHMQPSPYAASSSRPLMARPVRNSRRTHEHMMLDDYDEESDTDSHRSDDTYIPAESGDDAFEIQTSRARPSPQKRQRALKYSGGFRVGHEAAEPEPLPEDASLTERRKQAARKQRGRQSAQVKRNKANIDIGRARVATLDSHLAELRCRAARDAEELADLQDHIFCLECGVKRLGLGS